MTIKIFSPGHTLFAAKHLREQLIKLGHSVHIVGNIVSHEKDLCIIYNACSLNALPLRYVIYQTEVGSSHWFTPRYFNMIRKAVSVWDYSAENVKRYKQFNDNIHVVSPGIAPQLRCKKDIPITFYGWVEGSKRRKDLLRDIGSRVKINVVTNTLGLEMWKILSRTRVVLNLHYWERSPLELFRVHEALSFGCHVVSELPGVEKYNGLVHFTDMKNGVVEHLNGLINKTFDHNLEQLDNFAEVHKAINSIK